MRQQKRLRIQLRQIEAYAHTSGFSSWIRNFRCSSHFPLGNNTRVTRRFWRVAVDAQVGIIASRVRYCSDLFVQGKSTDRSFLYVFLAILRFAAVSILAILILPNCLPHISLTLKKPRGTCHLPSIESLF